MHCSPYTNIVDHPDFPPLEFVWLQKMCSKVCLLRTTPKSTVFNFSQLYTISSFHNITFHNCKNRFSLTPPIPPSRFGGGHPTANYPMCRLLHPHPQEHPGNPSFSHTITSPFSWVLPVSIQHTLLLLPTKEFFSPKPNQDFSPTIPPRLLSGHKHPVLIAPSY